MVNSNTNYPPKVDLLVIQGSRENVEAGNIEPVLKILNTLIEPQNIKKFADRMMFCIEGYCEDPRELAEIPEVRRWMKLLDDKWPFWFWFCSPYCLTLKFLAFVLSDLKKDSFGHLYLESTDFVNFMMSHFNGVNLMQEMKWISNKDNNYVTKKIKRYFSSNTNSRIF